MSVSEEIKRRYARLNRSIAAAEKARLETRNKPVKLYSCNGFRRGFDTEAAAKAYIRRWAKAMWSDIQFQQRVYGWVGQAYEGLSCYKDCLARAKGFYRVKRAA